MNAAALGVAACAAVAANTLDFKSSLMHSHHQTATAPYPFNTFNMYHHQHVPAATVVSPDEAAVSAAVAASSSLYYGGYNNWPTVKSGGSGVGKGIGAGSLFSWGSNANNPLMGNNSTNNYSHQGASYYYG